MGREGVSPQLTRIGDGGSLYMATLPSEFQWSPVPEARRQSIEIGLYIEYIENDLVACLEVT